MNLVYQCLPSVVLFFLLLLPLFYAKPSVSACSASPCATQQSLQQVLRLSHFLKPLLMDLAHLAQDASALSRCVIHSAVFPLLPAAQMKGLSETVHKFMRPPPPGTEAGDSCVLNKALCSCFLTSLGSSLWHSQERHGDRRNVRHEAGAHHEVHHPRRHGGYHRHLRPGRGSADCQQHCSKS